ncbi:right-handed parallel beta-helix repeat-containing protein [Ferruginibacter sp. SUN002]|uniref:right-handed parallel beta-helix repeat-containing protein n=1 Tax=Ferruginibacter sp. SUN002 TaxID=2937789 RepID=UPI003D35A943
MKLNLSFILFLIIGFITPDYLEAQTYYVSTTGNDANAGTEAAPFKTLTQALTKVTSSTTASSVSGITIYMRGGVYPSAATISIGSSKSGTTTKIHKLYSYPGERAIIDFATQTQNNSSSRGLSMSASYWHIKGIDFTNAGDNGMLLQTNASYNTIEWCAFYRNDDSGLQLSGGANNNLILNCDSYYNKDATSENADGFACKLDVGTGNKFRGCRAWQNSDDGWDGYLRPSDEIVTTLDSCWSIRNGYLESGATSGANGDRNGFKMGGSDATDLSHNMTLTHCIAVYNGRRGFDQNNNRGSMTLYNNFAYANASNFVMNSIALSAGHTMTVKNCIALNAAGTGTGTVQFASGAIVENNSWQSPFTANLTDFLSVDTIGMRGPRKADGSLPDVVFGKLANGSDFIDGGQNVGLAYSGSAPDLGPFEKVTSVSTTYTFTGNGNWDVAANWLNSTIPPDVITAGSQIIIDPIVGGECVLNKYYKLAPNTTLTVITGKVFRIPGYLQIVD